MWGLDRFHPSAVGYAAAAAALLPSVAAAVGVGPESVEQPEPFRGEAVLPIAEAAVAAAASDGTEVCGHPGRRQATAVRGAAGRSCGTAAGTRSPRWNGSSPTSTTSTLRTDPVLARPTEVDFQYQFGPC